MAVHKSTGFCNASVQNAVAGSPAAIWTTMQLRIFSGSAPATADAAETGTLLCVITEAAYAAVEWAGSATTGVLLKDGNTWSGVAGDTNAGTGSSATSKITSGTATAGYYRFVNKADTGASSTTLPRLQGDISTAGTELVLSSTTITFSATTTISYAALSITPN